MWMTFSGAHPEKLSVSAHDKTGSTAQIGNIFLKFIRIKVKKITLLIRKKSFQVNKTIIIFQGYVSK